MFQIVLMMFHRLFKLRFNCFHLSLRIFLVSALSLILTVKSGYFFFLLNFIIMYHRLFVLIFSLYRPSHVHCC